MQLCHNWPQQVEDSLFCTARLSTWGVSKPAHSHDSDPKEESSQEGGNQDQERVTVGIQLASKAANQETSCHRPHPRLDLLLQIRHRSQHQNHPPHTPPREDDSDTLELHASPKGKSTFSCEVKASMDSKSAFTTTRPTQTRRDIPLFITFNLMAHIWCCGFQTQAAHLAEGPEVNFWIHAATTKVKYYQTHH